MALVLEVTWWPGQGSKRVGGELGSEGGKLETWLKSVIQYVLRENSIHTSPTTWHTLWTLFGSVAHFQSLFNSDPVLTGSEDHGWSHPWLSPILGEHACRTGEKWNIFWCSCCSLLLYVRGGKNGDFKPQLGSTCPPTWSISVGVCVYITYYIKWCFEVNLIFGVFCWVMSDWENPHVHQAKQGPIGSEDRNRILQIESFTWAFWITDSESSWPLAVTLEVTILKIKRDRGCIRCW